MEQFSNRATTTLSVAMDTVTTTATVVSAGAFPSSSQYRIIIDSEIMLVTAGAGATSWTVTRAQEGTTATSHSIGATVKHTLTAGAMNNIQTIATNALDKTATSVQNLAGSITFSATKSITLTENSNDGHIGQLIIFKSTFDVDRPWMMWKDENNRNVAAMGYHTRLIDSLGGTVLKQLEIKTVANSASSNPADMRTRLAIQVDKQRITYGHTYTESLEVYQGENPITVGEGVASSFGLNLRTDPQDTVTAGASNFIVANFIAQVDVNDNAFLYIDVKPPYGTAPGTFTGPLGTIPAGNKSANLVFFRNVNSPSSSNPNIQIKKGDGTNTSSIAINAKSGQLQLLLATSSTAALQLGNDSVATLYRSAASTIKTDGNFITIGAVGTKVKAGTPTDADVTTPVDGMIIGDSTASKFWIRLGGVWKGVIVA